MQTNFSILSTGSIRYWKPLPRLHVEGRYIKNEYGQIVNLTGLNFFSLGYPISSYAPDWDGTINWRFGDPSVSRYKQTKEVITPYLVSKWKEIGVNSVRLLLNWYVWRGIYENRTPGSWPEYIPQVDLLVEECSKQGIYVILTFMQYSSHEFDGVYNTPETFKQEWIEWLVEVVTRYKDNPAVAGIDIINEPKLEHWAGSWKNRNIGHEVYYSAALEAAQAIHNANPNILIFIETGLQQHPRWTKFDPYLIDHPIHTQVPNVVYEFHRYYFQTYLYRSKESPEYPDNGPLLPDGLDYPASYKNGDYELARQQMEQVWYDELFYVLDKGYPMWYGEFGFKGGYDRYGNLVEPAWDVVLNDTLQLCNKYGVGWSYLGWDSGIGDRYGVLLRDDNGYYTVYEEPKAGIVQQNFMFLPDF
jgi:hypothetical protein